MWPSSTWGPTRGASGAPTRTRCSPARRCSWWPTEWAARRPERSPRGSRSSPFSTVSRIRRTPRASSPHMRARPMSASTSARRRTPSTRAWARRSPPCTWASEEVAIAHVGDSRAYCLRDGELLRLTDDHSLVDELIRQGKLTPEEAVEHPQRSVITRALGPEPEVEIDTRSYPRPRRGRVSAVQRWPHDDGSRRARSPRSCWPIHACATPARR